MTTPPELYRRATALGFRLEAREGQLAVTPASKLPADLKATLRQHKAALLDWLNQQPPRWRAVPPEGLPLVTTEPTPTPDRRERVIGYLLRQGCDRPGPLTAWLVRRELAYFEGCGRHWDCALHAYAAARDAACWQLEKSEEELWATLEGSDEEARDPF